MFDYFKGYVTDKKRTSKGAFLTIETNSIGYLLEITEHDFLQFDIDEKNQQKIYVLLTHREDAMSLYGFQNKETRDIFQILLSVSGVGAKMAIALLNEFDACDLISLVIDGDFKELTKAKQIESFEYLRQLPNTTARLALKDVVFAYEMFFSGLNNKPHFKSKKKRALSFKTRKERCYIKNGRLRIEGLPRFETIECSCHEYDGLNGYPHKNTSGFTNVSITCDKSGKFYISFLYESNKRELNIPVSEPIGIDLGVRKTFTLSNGKVYNQPDTSRLERKTRMWNRRLTKDYKRIYDKLSKTKIETGNERLKFDDIPKSKRCLKREEKMRKVYKRISDIKRTFYYQTVNDILNTNPEAICIETIRVEDLKKKNPFTIKSVTKVSFYEISQIIKHKCAEYGIPLIVADKEYPSSQLCSKCGYRYKDIGSKKIFRCPECGMTLDRDINAALNLKSLYVK